MIIFQLPFLCNLMLIPSCFYLMLLILLFSKVFQKSIYLNESVQMELN